MIIMMMGLDCIIIKFSHPEKYKDWITLFVEIQKKF
jgi:hypothetical protein